METTAAETRRAPACVTACLRPFTEALEKARSLHSAHCASGLLTSLDLYSQIHDGEKGGGEKILPLSMRNHPETPPVKGFSRPRTLEALPTTLAPAGAGQGFL